MIEISKEVLEKLYCEDRKKQREIAAMYNIKRSDVSNLLQKYKIKKPKKKIETKELKNHNKIWTKEDDEFLADKVGTLSYNTIAKSLGRTPKAIFERKKFLKLENQMKDEDYINKTFLAESLGIDRKIIKKWEEKQGLKIKVKNVAINKYVSRIKIEDFWKWAEKHSDLINWEKFKADNLGVEPDWVREVRLNYDKPKKRCHKWTDEEDRILISSYKAGLSIKAIAENLKRTEYSVKTRLTIKDIKRTNVRTWKASEVKKLKELSEEGYTLKAIARKLNRTVRAIQNAKQRYINRVSRENVTG